MGNFSQHTPRDALAKEDAEQISHDEDKEENGDHNQEDKKVGQGNSHPLMLVIDANGKLIILHYDKGYVTTHAYFLQHQSLKSYELYYKHSSRHILFTKNSISFNTLQTQS